MPGSGKSTLGKKLAKQLAYNWLDSDKLIENKTGKTISEIFKTNGENYFREIEKSILSELIVLNNTVISCGGGMPIFNNNGKTMLEHGFCIYLNAEIKLLADRIKEGKNKRPQFSGNDDENILSNLETILEKREAIYLQANIHIKIPEKNPNAFILEASRAFKEYINFPNSGN
jgi:shikimate kinase